MDHSVADPLRPGLASAPAVPMRRLLDLPFADLDLPSAAAWVDTRDAGAPFGYVVTPNADHLVRLARYPAFLPLYTNAALCLLDSRVVARTAALLGLDPPVMTTGSDLTVRLIERHVRPGERITVIGMEPAALAKLVERTGIAPPHHHQPPMGFDEDPAALARAIQFVVDHPARLVFLGLGSPRQEKLAAAIAATRAATGTGLCIGASLEFMAGTMARAPVFMREAGLEWLHRLISNPRRLARRYLLDCPVVFRLLWRSSRAATHQPGTVFRPTIAGPKADPGIGD